MNLLGSRWNKTPRHSSLLYPEKFFIEVPGERILIKKAQQIAFKIFECKQDLWLSFSSISNFSGSTVDIALHPLFSFTPDEIPKEFVEKNIPEKKVKKWVSSRFNSGVNLEKNAFSPSWKLFRYLVRHPKYYEGVRNFILANEFAAVDEGNTFFVSQFYTDVNGSPRLTLAKKTVQVFPFLAIGLSVYLNHLFVLTLGVASLAALIFWNWRTAKMERRILQKAVKATGDVDSAIIYYRLIRFYNPRKWDWIRRKTIDRVMGYHDPLKTLSAFPKVQKQKKKDSFAGPFFSRA